MKPANILLENGVDRALLTDFGLARAADDATLTHSGIIAGTPHYMAPEQARGRPADARSDLFSLGAVLYFMATGHPPFRADQAMAILNRICHDRHRDVQEINPAIPDDLADAIDRLLEKKPGRRFSSAEEVRQTLERALASLQKGPSTVRRMLRKLRQRRRILATAACLLLVLLGSSWVVKKIARPSGVASDGDPMHRASPIDPTLAESVRRDEATFGIQLAAANQSLHEIESVSFPEVRVLQNVANQWQAEAQRVDSDLSQLEQSWSIRTKLSSQPSDSSNGDKR